MMELPLQNSQDSVTNHFTRNWEFYPDSHMNFSSSCNFLTFSKTVPPPHTTPPPGISQPWHITLPYHHLEVVLEEKKHMESSNPWSATLQPAVFMLAT